MAPTNTLLSFPSPPRTTYNIVTVEQGGNRGFVFLLLVALFLGACIGYVPIHILYRYWEARTLKKSNNTPETWTTVHFSGCRQPANKGKHSDTKTTSEEPSDGLAVQSEERTPPSTQSDESFQPTFPTRAVLASSIGSVKSLSHDRAAQIIANPKLAPVQGPLRPLSMEHPSYGRQLSTFFLLLFARFKRRHRQVLGGRMSEGKLGGAN